MYNGYSFILFVFFSPSNKNLEPRVAETAIVGYPHEIYGEGIILCYNASSSNHIKRRHFESSHFVRCREIVLSFLYKQGEGKGNAGPLLYKRVSLYS